MKPLLLPEGVFYYDIVFYSGGEIIPHKSTLKERCYKYCALNPRDFFEKFFFQKQLKELSPLKYRFMWELREYQPKRLFGRTTIQFRPVRVISREEILKIFTTVKWLP